VNCKNIIKELSNYLEDALDQPLKSSIEHHLEGCEDCRIVVDTTKHTVQIFCNSEPAPLPEETRARLRDALFKHSPKPKPRGHRAIVPIFPTASTACPFVFL
jgi:predicted anti-sigma-YlaC factor YlaD